VSENESIFEKHGRPCSGEMVCLYLDFEQDFDCESGRVRVLYPFVVNGMVCRPCLTQWRDGMVIVSY
jgi:hypothetical protein